MGFAPVAAGGGIAGAGVLGTGPGVIAGIVGAVTATVTTMPHVPGVAECRGDQGGGNIEPEHQIRSQQNTAKN